MKRAYKNLLHLYPKDYREVFAAEMLAVFEEASDERRGRSLLRFALVELMSLVIGAGDEWIAKLTYGVYHSNSYISGRCLPDRQMMRPAGVTRTSYSAGQTAVDLIDEAGMCVNAHQRLVFASPLRRLLIFTCAVFLPVHPKARIWNRPN